MVIIVTKDPFYILIMSIENIIIYSKYLEKVQISNMSKNDMMVDSDYFYIKDSIQTLKI